MVYRLQLMRLRTTPIHPPSRPGIYLTIIRGRSNTQNSRHSIPAHRHSARKQVVPARRVPQESPAPSLADSEQTNKGRDDENGYPNQDVVDPAPRRVSDVAVHGLRVHEHVPVLIDGRHAEVPGHVALDIEGRLERDLPHVVEVHEPLRLRLRLGSEIRPLGALQHPPLDLGRAVPRDEDPRAAGS
ncbi:hypothetical protein CHU98_g11458, partial [Xylaria longipes]